jgi:hypothetical protein
MTRLRSREEVHPWIVDLALDLSDEGPPHGGSGPAWQAWQAWQTWQDTLVAAVGTHSHLLGEHELQEGDEDSGRREAALPAEPVWVPRTATPR